MGLAIDPYRLAENTAIRTQPVPQSVSQNHGVVLARYALLRKEVASHQERNSLHAEPARRGPHTIELLRLVLRRQIKTASGEGAQLLERFVLRLPVEKVSR